MGYSNDRRRFLKTASALGVGLGIWNLQPPVLLAGEGEKGTPNAEKLGWRVACCAYTYRSLPLFESIAQTAQFGLRLLEGYTWQGISKDQPKTKADDSMSAELRQETRKRLDDAGVKLVSIYADGFSRKRFEFCKELGIETVVGEPTPQELDAIEKLCDELQINLAIHNHAKPSAYWNPEKVLELCKGRSNRIGFCADTGHWVRSGLKPAEELKKLEGRLLTFHLKDIKPAGSEDCPWGTGRADVEATLKEVHRQKAKVVWGIEYESADFMTAIPVCTAYLEKVAAGLT